MDPIPGVDVLQMDFLDADAPELLSETLGGAGRRRALRHGGATPPATARPTICKIMALAEAAADFAREVLEPGGAFLAKVLQGGTEGDAARRAQARLRHACSHVKPPASRADRPSSTAGEGVSRQRGRG